MTRTSSLISASLSALVLVTASACFVHRSPAPDRSSSEASSGGATAGSGAGASAAAAVPASAPAVDRSLDPQSDAGAGKAVDLAKVASSPKNGSPYLGPKDALVIVNVFSDFQCPVCRRSADPIKQLVADFPGKVKVVFRNNALEMHGRSRPAALAAMAAGKQGRFWPYYDKLFVDQASLDDASLRRDAEALGLDLAAWEKDVANPKNAERVKTESDWANSLGAAGTPSFFINGLRQVGWGSYQGLKSMVQREIANSEQLIAAGTPAHEVVAARIREMSVKNSVRQGDPAVDPEHWVQVLTAD